MTTDSASPNATANAIPTGRDEVIAAILDSAGQLFDERGPAASSIRDIAARARVNHGLVFRHFGTKEQLVAAVLDHLAAHLIKLMDSAAPESEIEAATNHQLRVVARALLDGVAVNQLQTGYPAASRLLDLVRIQHGSDDNARLATAHAIALLFGWQLFAPFIRSATGLGMDEISPEELRQSIRTEMARLAEPH
jgi:TetR/AcrR family transcriptional regulator, repressor for neighboring sulfatase